MDTIAALEAARAAVRVRESDFAIDAAVRNLSVALGTPRPEVGTFRAIRAVLFKLEHAENYSRDQDAWEAHGASRASFVKWKQRIHTCARAMVSST